jgi:hypothetical protein
MAALATQFIAQAGLTPAYVAASGGGDTFTPGDKTFLHIKNASGAPITLTLLTYPDTSPWGSAIPDQTVTIPATVGDKMIGPLVGSQYANPATGLGGLTYSGVTSLTVAVISQ